MRCPTRRVWQARRIRASLLALAAAPVFAVALLVPADGGASRVGHLARGIGNAIQRVTAPTRQGQSFAGTPAVGALFSETSGRLGQHFCTASVVHSAGGDLAVTAAHCVAGVSGSIAFVPGYVNGATPYGVWQVSQIYTDANWRASQDPDDDVAFLRLSRAADGVPVEDVTGAERLGTGRPAHSLVQVIGYPDGANQPVWCLNWADSFSPTQLQFYCGGYTNGTSGGPFLTAVSASSGQGTVIGVIGGYEQGGDTPSVSYSAAFGANVASLFQTAEADG